MSRIISYPEALKEAMTLEMESDEHVFILGQGVDDPKAILGTTAGILDKFGPKRIFDVPLAEDGITGIALGAAIAGLKPIHIHIRNDFLLLAMNQIVNMVAKMRYMYGGVHTAPMVIRATIGKSWGQGPQHSQSIYPMLMNVPGLRIVAPTTPYDAKGIMAASIRSSDPVIFIEHRSLYYQKGDVPKEAYALPFGKARTLAQGDDVTLVGVSQMAIECLRASKCLNEVGIHAHVIDPVTISPLDIDTILTSVKKTKHLVVVDNSWLPGALGAEIIAACHESQDCDFKSLRLGFAATPCPTTPSLEDAFYVDGVSIAKKINHMLRHDSDWIPNTIIHREEVEFKGPF